MFVSEAVSSQRVLLQSRFLAFSYSRSPERRDCFATLAETEKGGKQSRLFTQRVSLRGGMFVSEAVSLFLPCSRVFYFENTP